MLTWLPFVRSIFDGGTYEWGITMFGHMFHGAGITWDFLFLVGMIIFYAALMFSMYWVKNRTYFYGLSGIWFILTMGNFLLDILMNGDTRFNGDTLGVSVSLSAIVIPLSVIALGIIIFMIKTDLRSEEVEIQWNKKNKRNTFLIFGFLPIQAVLLMIGEPHALTDEIGVLISIAQCFVLPMIYRPKIDITEFELAQA